MKYAFIKDNHNAFSVQLYRDLFKVSRSGYYGSLNRKRSYRELNNQRLDTKIKILYKEHKPRAGSPRITIDLNASSERCSEN